MKVLLTGGGTGGHITPLLAVAHEIKRQNPTHQIVYIGERGGKFAHLTDGHHTIDVVYTVYAGKFRRYHGQSWLRRLTDVKTIFMNIRDLFYFVVGIVQSWRLLGRVKPDIIFLKGGFVGVPIGLAAAARRIPYVTHDSDALPGLANRIVSRWARLHTTALPPQKYPYPASKTRQVGVLVSPDYQPVSAADQAVSKRELGMPEKQPLLIITGGSLGATRLNQAMVAIVDDLLRAHPDLRIIHQVGKGKIADYKGYTHPRLQIVEFMIPMYHYTGAADIVVTRAGANTLAELGVQGRACIVVPNPDLTGGHQIHNANALAALHAVMVVSEAELPYGLNEAVNQLLSDSKLRSLLGQTFRHVTIADAAHQVAKLLLGQKT